MLLSQLRTVTICVFPQRKLIGIFKLDLRFRSLSACGLFAVLRSGFSETVSLYVQFHILVFVLHTVVCFSGKIHLLNYLIFGCFK